MQQELRKQSRRMLRRLVGSLLEVAKNADPLPPHLLLTHGCYCSVKHNVWEWKEGNNAARKLRHMHIYEGSMGLCRTCRQCHCSNTAVLN